MSRVQRNEFGRFTETPPAWLMRLRQQHPGLVAKERWIWEQSLELGSPWLLDSVEKYFRKVRPAREHSVLVYQNDDKRTLRFDTRFKGELDPKTGRYDTIYFPRTGLPVVAGHRLIIVEHTHPDPYGFGVAAGPRTVKGPFDADQLLARIRPDILYIIQAMMPEYQGRQWFYYGMAALDQ